ncbi:uncharacterized protein LOC141909880 [Tubulanus polymorphus]|uniref:uncharacterized protein LOC141909880 n=1 Tax=Tubulanus polymorphus TaxID=672921 RepID=UPI003DA224B3
MMTKAATKPTQQESKMNSSKKPPTDREKRRLEFWMKKKKQQQRDSEGVDGEGEQTTSSKSKQKDIDTNFNYDLGSKKSKKTQPLKNESGFIPTFLKEKKKPAKLDSDGDGETSAASPPAKKRKKKKNEDSEKLSELSSELSSETPPAKTPAAAAPSIKQKSKLLYVLFVGNLPFTTTIEKIEKHFQTAGKVNKVRLPVVKETGKPRGFAYVEFADGKSFKQGLLLHRSELGGRKINVEYTSIGGKSEKRTQKLKQKNKSLERFKSIKGDRCKFKTS